MFGIYQAKTLKPTQDSKAASKSILLVDDKKIVSPGVKSLYSNKRDRDAIENALKGTGLFCFATTQLSGLIFLSPPGARSIFYMITGKIMT